MNIQYYQYMETVYNDSFEQKQNKFSVQQELSKILDYLQDFDVNIKGKVMDKFSMKEKLNMELQYNLNCFNISINIIGLYFQDEAIESQKEIESLVNKILQYVEEFHKFIDISSYAKRITEVLLYCLCNVVEKIDLNKVVNYQNEYLEICFMNSKSFPLLRLSSAIISSFLNSHNNKIRDDLLKYFDEISNSLMDDKENEFNGIDKKLIGNASKFLKHQNYTFRKDGLISDDQHTDQAYRSVMSNAWPTGQICPASCLFMARQLVFTVVQLQLFSNPFAVNPDIAPAQLQMELIDLQFNTMFKTKFQSKTLQAFYQEVPNDTFPLLRKHAAFVLSMFGSPYLCEQAFSKMSLVKTKLRSRLTETNLKANLRIALAVDLKPDISKLVKSKQCQVSTASKSNSELK